MKCPKCQQVITVPIRDVLAGHDAHAVLAQVLSFYASNFWGWQRNPDQFRGISFSSKGEYQCSAVGKSWSADGTPIVCFASGMDTVSALLAISGVIGRGEWKVDQWAKQAKNGENGS